MMLTLQSGNSVTLGHTVVSGVPNTVRTEKEKKNKVKVIITF